METTILNPNAVRAWVTGQRRAQKRIEAEKAKFLARLSPKASLEIYLDLATSFRHLPTRHPSVVLLAMRKATAKMYKDAA